MKKLVMAVLAMAMTTVVLFGTAAAEDEEKIVPSKYVVQKDDTLSEISKKLELSVKEIKFLNPQIKDDLIRPDETIFYISQKDREAACERWTKVINQRGLDEEIMMAGSICAAIFLKEVGEGEDFAPPYLFFMNENQISEVFPTLEIREIFPKIE